MKLAVATTVIVLSLAGLSRQSDAQTCVGSASFGAGALRLGASASFSDGSKLYGGEFAAGAPHGVFAALDAGSVSYNGGGSSSVIGATLGYDVAVGPVTSFCPFVGYTHLSFPDINTGTGTITSSGNNINFGGALGMTAKTAPNFDLVPFVSAQYVHASVSSNFAGVGSNTASDDYGLLGVGVGFVFSKRVTFNPSVSVPVGIKGAKTSVGIGLSVNFGRTMP